MNKKCFKQNKGFSLVELAIGLAVITVLILAISVSAGIRDNARLQSAANSVQTLRSAAENFITDGNINYKDLTVENLKLAKLLPDNFTAGGSNPWGGDFNVVANPTNNTRFDISLTGLAQADANKLNAYFNNNASGLSFNGGTWIATF